MESIKYKIQRKRKAKFKLKKIRDLESINEAYSNVLENLKLNVDNGIEMSDAKMLCLMLKDFSGMIENEKLRKLEVEIEIVKEMFMDNAKTYEGKQKLKRVLPHIELTIDKG